MDCEWNIKILRPKNKLTTIKTFKSYNDPQSNYVDFHGQNR